MNEIIDFFTKQEIPLLMMVFFMLFSMGIAIFHTFIFRGLYRFKFNGWTFFILNPTLIGSAWLIDNRLALVVFLGLSVSVFLYSDKVY
jgi:hypothetical protein